MSRLQARIRGVLRDGRLRGEVGPHVEVDALTDVVRGSFYGMLLTWLFFPECPLEERARNRTQPRRLDRACPGGVTARLPEPPMPVDRDQRFPFPIPTGWFAVAWSDELAPLAVQQLRYFARDLVLFRTASGAARVLDAFCPHLGAHLGAGRVAGETIVCPFHAWAWDGEGRCVDVPYAKRIPPKARIGSWPVAEHSGVVFVWHDAEGRPPSFEVPPHPELADPDWAPVERHEFHVATCVQEIMENAHDPAHFHAVHGVEAVPANASEFDGPRHVAENRGKLWTPRGNVETSIRGTSHGMGVGHLRTRGLADMAQLLLQTPIDAEHVHVRWQFAVPKGPDGTPSPVGVAFAREFVRQFRQDIPIWEGKRYLPRPLLCDGDGDIARFRRWTTQFYPGAAEEMR